jgi:DNA-binding NarL/FixJ family response regulator
MRRGFMGRDTRTIVEKIDDMLADGIPCQQIADELYAPYNQVRARYLNICHKLGEKPDAE